ncbi:MAG: N-acetylmuramoyl-L-alanine amidase [Geminicoccaceae bacterium]
MRRIELPSPNRDARPPGARIDLLVLHYTGMPSAAAAIDRLRDPATKVSAHFLIDEDGAVCAMVPEEARAWHAGASEWQGRAALNDVSLGIELANPGHEWGYRAFPAAQMAALLALASELCRRWNIPPDRVVGHSDVAPTRKEDPGELFDWPALARAGLCHAVPPTRPVPPDEAAARAAMMRFGYPDAPTIALVCAFQRRWRPARCDGVLDAETMGLALAVGALRPDAATAT